MTYILETENLVKNFKGFQAVGGVSFKVRRGGVHALIGPNGAGKTTCFNLLTKFIPPTGGTIIFNGSDISRISAAAVSRLGMTRSFQISSVFSRMSALENVEVALQRREGNSLHFWRSKSTLSKLDERALSLLQEVGLDDLASVDAAELSYGRKRALEIATTLAVDPELLLLDEPMAGMGQEDIRRMTELIGKVAATRTVLMVEHNLSVVQALCDQVTVLAGGKVLAAGSYSEVASDRRVRDAYLGGGAAHV